MNEREHRPDEPADEDGATAVPVRVEGPGESAGSRCAEPATSDAPRSPGETAGDALPVASLLYLGLPSASFIVGWLRPAVSVPLLAGFLAVEDLLLAALVWLLLRRWMERERVLDLTLV